MAEMVRVNTRISSKLNAWLDKESEETGIPKSTLVMLALEDYKKQRDAIDTMSDMGALLSKLERIERALPSGK